MTTETKQRFTRWFWRPPRVHGEVIVDRRVTFLELFYDLVYVVVISQATHHLAESISVRTVVEFVIIFALIFIAWINGSLYLELHGREDGRTRSIVFIQMGILAVLAVFTGQAGHTTGTQFALTYVAFLVCMTWAWNLVRNQDRLYRPEYLAVTLRYLVLLVASIVVFAVSAFLPDDARLALWAGYAIAWIAGFWYLDRARSARISAAVTPTHSLVERFNLFTIIVLGEVVLGVVEGLSQAEHDLVTLATGVLALGVGFGFWWIYFDLVGHRLPRAGHSVVYWIISHFPITLAISAGGAAVVSLIVHAHDPTTPAETSWLLCGAVALSLLATIVASRTLDDADRLPGVYKPLSGALALGAAATLPLGAFQPAPVVLVTLIGVILTVLWLVAVGLFIRADAWGES